MIKVHYGFMGARGGNIMQMAVCEANGACQEKCLSLTSEFARGCIDARFVTDEEDVAFLTAALDPYVPEKANFIKKDRKCARPRCDVAYVKSVVCVLGCRTRYCSQSCRARHAAIHQTACLNKPAKSRLSSKKGSTKRAVVTKEKHEAMDLS